MKKIILYIATFLLSLSYFFLPISAEEQNKYLGASQLTTENTWNSTTTKKLYFGQYNNDPMLYRILKSNQDEILLDCDTVITNLPFNNDDRTADFNNWSTSDLRNWLNGNDFYFKDSVFNSIERNLILTTNHSEETYDLIVNSGWETTEFKDFTSTEKIYLLSTKEVFHFYESNEEHLDKSDTDWWLRTAHRPSMNNSNLTYVGYNGYGGKQYGFELGVSPAFRINPSSILLTTEISSNTYEFTLLDPDMNLSTNLITKHLENGKTLIKVLYSYSDNNINQANTISLLVTDKEYTERDASILFYQNITSSIQENGILTFELPENLNSIDHIYLLAEKITDERYTDYSSNPVEINIPDAYSNVLISVQNPIDVIVENGTAMEDILLPNKTIIKTELNPEGIQADIHWNFFDNLYDPNKHEEQSFTLTGSVSITQGVTNPNGVSTTVTVKVTVKGKDILIENDVVDTNETVIPESIVTTSPNTGDNQYIIISVILTIASAVLLIGYLVYWKIKHR